MHYQILPIFYLIIFGGIAWGAHDQGPAPSFPWPPLSPSSVQALKKGAHVVDSQVDTKKVGDGERQSLTFFTAGLHPRSCALAMRKLSRYELYPQWLDFVKEAVYNEETQRLRLVLDHTLLPFKMQIDFKLPRIRGPGSYPYSFDRGFVAGLRGDIQLSEDSSLPEKDRRCLFYATAQWEGPYSGIPDTAFEIFSTTLTRAAMEKLFRLSSVGP